MTNDPGPFSGAVARWHLAAWSMLLADHPAPELGINSIALNYSLFFYFFTAKDFIRNLMEKDPNKRYTCEQAARHPW